MKFDPIWWSRARELRAKGLSLPAIGRLVKRSHTAVLFAVADESWRERRRAAARARTNLPPPHTDEQRKRGYVVAAARQEAEASGRHVDQVLVEWGAPPRRASRSRRW